MLGIDEVRAADLGLRLYKVACPGRSSQRELKRFARGARDHHRRRGEALAGRDAGARAALRPRRPADLDRQEGRERQLAVPGEGRARRQPDRDLHRRASCCALAATRNSRRAWRSSKEAQRGAGRRDAGRRHAHAAISAPAARTISSTVVPEGIRAYAGIGCHYMVQWMDRGTAGFTQMGGGGRQLDRRGAVLNARPRVPESRRRHLQPFRLSGDPRGGRGRRQHHLQDPVQRRRRDDRRAAQRRRAHRAADRARRWRPRARSASCSSPTSRTNTLRHATGRTGVTIHHRDELDAVQGELARVKGLTVLIYDQTCAAEKRRRRKRGNFPDPDKRVIINELVCEGCGDCGVKSNCVSVQPLETEFGRKRTIDQSSCNKDFSCLKGFCPSFVTVHGARLKKAAQATAAQRHRRRCREPQLPALEQTYGIIITGVGGTGVVTVGAVLGMAAHLEGRASASSTWRGSRRRAARSQPHAHRRRPGANPRHPRRRAAGPTWCSPATSWSPAARRCWPRSRPGRPASSSTSPRTCRAISPAMRTFSLPTERLKRAIAAAGRRAARISSMPARVANARCRASHRRQHVHAGLCLAARRAAALGGGDRAGDRAERRGGGDECWRPSAGAAAPPPIRKALEALACRAERSDRRAPPVAEPRRDRRAARRLPDGLPERRLCRAL